MAFQAPRGTTDLLPPQAHALDRIQRIACSVFGLYGYGLIETPAFEQLDVFVRGIGQDTDVVGKEMFHVLSPGALAKQAEGAPLRPDDVLALRPEQTASVARAAVQHGLVPPDGATVKLWYRGTMFRAERPQKGRLREFHQVGAECLGAAGPSADAEAVVMLMHFFEECGIPRGALRLLLNSMGDAACRPAYRSQVRAFILDHAADLCPECVRRADTNPLRAFDCKNEGCRQVLADAPRITDLLCDDCAAHYASVKALLDAARVPYEEDPRLVRGLDYYTRTVFEVQADAGLGSQNALGGGGRYDGLIQEFGGRPTPGLGFAVGLERVQLVLEATGNAPDARPVPAAYLAAVDEDARPVVFALAQELRAAGLAAELDHQGRSLKSQFKQADRSGAPVVLVVGPDERAAGAARMRHMGTHEERTVALDAVVDAVKGECTATQEGDQDR
ncbi:MAG: histidine--tRNA ligase [Coriobacteriales bacterium]|jgi:histidyl-tRNA synthetase|nr:histidine--tRNA ligase [Coriobacteriales bacterium]